MGAHAYVQSMSALFIPYLGNRPATIDVNGHRIVILAEERAQLEECLEAVGAERVFEVDPETFRTTEEAVNGIAEATHARVITAPPDVNLLQLLDGLKYALPWVQ